MISLGRRGARVPPPWTGTPRQPPTDGETIVNEPIPKKTSAITSAQAVTLCVLFVCVAAVCIVGMILAADVYR